jgi:NodT family efflux transporter outer membrane factor (OMF) lipoprotein
MAQPGRLARWAALGASLATCGCTVGPNYLRPAAPVPIAFKELKGWTVSAPRDDVPKGAWWEVFHDPILNRLESEVQVNNQTVKAALAALDESQAIVGEARSELYPSLTASGSLTRGVNAAGGSPATSATEEFEGTWAPDLWGKIRRTIASDVAAAQVSAADLQNATLSEQGALATDYYQLRASDSLQTLLDTTVVQFRRALQITENQYKAGTAPRSDVLTAQTQLLTTQAQAINVGVARAQFEHAIAVLMGRPPAELAVSAGRLPTIIPMVPVGLPSTLLERRPDIAAAERTMLEENELIGVAIAGYFPNFSLSALAGAAGDPFEAAASASSLVWSLGAAGTQTLFNGFLTQAQVKAAKAAYEESVGDYRQTVLTALEQVEDQLVALRILARQATAEDAAVRAAVQSVTIALNEYQAGTQAYTTVITAQTTALGNEETALTVREDRMLAVVSLIQALGGGWSAAVLPTE